MSATSNEKPLVALVTGASSGIGLHIALGLARAGMGVLMAGATVPAPRRPAGL